ncbi:MAG TPA: ankyrin repeat domain-containing protein [Vicinamibacteria bacterium]|nr:ankyrin repeat domain-containing protein [Vicinamibacteria bacterium]
MRRRASLLVLSAALLPAACEQAVPAGNLRDRIVRFRTAVENGDEAAVRRMLDEDAGLGRMESGEFPSPLRLAAQKGHVKIVEMIADTGVDLADQGPADGWTALHDAASAGHAEVVRALVKKGANPHTPDASGNTPLLLVGYGDAEIVHALLEAKARVVHKNQAGETVLHRLRPTALHFAIPLCAAGADPALRSASGQQPYQAIEQAAKSYTFSDDERDWFGALVAFVKPGGGCTAVRGAQWTAAERKDAVQTIIEESLCTAGRGSACRNAGVRHEHGTGTPVDPARAVTFYEKACAAGDPTGCAYQGWGFEQGFAGKKDLRRARELYGKACEANDAWGCGALADLYYDGQGVAKSYPRAVALFRKACDGGSAWACGQLGHAMENGYGFPAADPAGAAKLFDGACEKDLGYACWRLSELVAAGTGVAKDRARAAALAKKACEKGEKRAC